MAVAYETSIHDICLKNNTLYNARLKPIKGTSLVSKNIAHFEKLAEKRSLI